MRARSSARVSYRTCDQIKKLSGVMHIGNRANYLILELDMDTFRRPRLEVTIAQSNHTKSLVGVEDDGPLDVVTGDRVDVTGLNVAAVLR